MVADHSPGGFRRAPDWQMAGPILAAVLLGLLKFALYWIAAYPFGGAPVVLCHWDCNWYLSILTHGYQLTPMNAVAPGQANWAFFPLYPTLVRCFLWLASSPQVAGLLASELCALVFAAAFTWYARLRCSRQSAWLWPALLAVWPFSLYWQMVYSEALYAMLAVFTLAALARQRLLQAALAAALLSATRPTGVILSVWIAGRSLWCGLMALRERPRAPLSRIVADALLPTAIAPLGLVAFAGFLGWKIGDPLAFSHVQVAWHRALSNPLDVLANALRLPHWTALRYWWTSPPSLPYAIIAVAGIACGGFLAWRRHFAEAFFIVATVMMALTSGNIMSMQRYVGANPVSVLVVGELFALARGRSLRIALIGAMVATQVLLLLIWFGGSIVLA